MDVDIMNQDLFDKITEQTERINIKCIVLPQNVNKP